MNIDVRQACENDLDEIEQLFNDLNDYLACHVNYPRWSKGVYPLREHAREAIAKGSFYVAVADGKIAGTASYETYQGDPYREVNWNTDFDVPVFVIEKLAVHPEFFGCGVGKALLDYSCVIGRQQGKKAVRLDTFEENIPAARLFEKCGFSYCGTVDLGLEEIYGLKWYKVFEKLL